MAGADPIAIIRRPNVGSPAAQLSICGEPRANRSSPTVHYLATAIDTTSGRAAKPENCLTPGRHAPRIVKLRPEYFAITPLQGVEARCLVLGATPSDGVNRSSDYACRIEKTARLRGGCQQVGTDRK